MALRIESETGDTELSRTNDQKKIIKILALIILGLTVLFFILFIIHIINVEKYNEEWREITAGASTTQVVVDIHPRGGATDSWIKTDTGLGTNLCGKIYELVVTNNAHTNIDDWNIRFQISEDCYLNNGWCGTFEVHQFDEAGRELVQTIDLRNFSYDALKVNYHHAGQDLLIPLRAGDFIIYHPDTSDVSGEIPIKGNEEMSAMSVIGFIMYSKSGNVELNDYVMSYRLHRSLWDGSSGKFYIFVIFFLALSYIILATVSYVAFRFEDRIKRQNILLKDIFNVCFDLADSRDYFSKEHSERVADYSRMIAEKLGMDKSDCEIVYYAALLHNIGNVFVNEQILRKSGKLTKEEYAEVKKHTVRGAELLKDRNGIPSAAEAALYHHERYDGSGYPHGKKGEEIPLIARIIAVADAYDAMNNDRPYRKKLMHDQIREELIKNRGSQFDPEIVTAFLDIMGERNL